MEEYRVKSFAELHDALGHHRRDAGWIYRGHADPHWELVPRAGRPPFAGRAEEVFFRFWKAEALQDETIQINDDWNWLAMAQHHGFATRLLDWTSKPLAAAWFAVADPGDGDSAIICFKTGNVLRDTKAQTPFERQGVTQFTPTKVSSRVSRQIGVFTHHNPATLSLQKGMTPLDRMDKIIIDRSYRSELMFELNQYGVNAQTLFPHMVGLSRHFNWIMSSFDYWAEGLTGVKREKNETRG
ncbi:MAG: hypothetical protein ACI8W7_001343 [Gammaproteobacteria bacterium]|jgi:hypothetical protein